MGEIGGDDYNFAGRSMSRENKGAPPGFGTRGNSNHYACRQGKYSSLQSAMIELKVYVLIFFPL